MPPPHPQFLTDANGQRLSVVLSLAEYEAMIEHIEDLEDLEAARQARGEPSVPFEEVVDAIMSQRACTVSR